MSEPLGPSRTETEVSRPEVVFIDEHSPQNPYSKLQDIKNYINFSETPNTFSAASTEGFSHNQTGQRIVGRSLATLFDLQSKGQTLDVGWGTNSFVSEGIHQSTNNPAVLLDRGDRGGAPKVSDASNPKFKYFAGDISNLSDPESALKDEKFGMIMFNGSWVAGGNNWTVHNILSGLYDSESQRRGTGQNIENDRQNYQKYLDQQIYTILKNAKDHLVDDGVLCISSSRFAYHGAGYVFSALPSEKIDYLDVVQKAVALGAKKITVLGVSAEGLQESLDFNLTDRTMYDMRVAQVMRESLLGGMSARSRILVTHEDGTPFSSTEIQAICEDATQRAKFFRAHPEILTVVRAKLKANEDLGKTIVDQLTGGVRSLPEVNSPISKSPTDVRLLKQATKDLLPPAIGRIDAVGIQF